MKMLAPLPYKATGQFWPTCCKLRDYALALGKEGLPRYLVGVPLAGFGDQLLLTAAFRELRRRGNRGLWAMTFQPEFFHNNPDVDHVIPPWRFYRTVSRAFRAKVITPYHTEYVAEEDRWVAPQRHAIANICKRVGVRGSVAVRPYLYLHDAERAAGRLLPRQVGIMSSGMSARHPMLNRQWPAERFQQVVDRLRGAYDFVQLGAAGDPLLDGVLDRRGLPFRPSAAILAASRFFIGQEGFLAHLARAVDCRSVVVFGGFARPDQTGYICNENLYTPVRCAPCWAANACDRDRECMTRITVDDVVVAVGCLALRLDRPIETEIIAI
jgi:hypothetical protein